MIANCGHDERNKYSGGKAGDQTGGEWAVIPWYDRGWNVVLRHPDQKVGQLIADLAYEAAQNDLIGYDQNQRVDYWYALVKASYRPAQIDTLCEADCSAGVAANVKAAGYLLNDEKLKAVSIYCYTGNLRAALKAAGFEELTDRKYLTSDQYLLPGDILLLEGHHVTTNLSVGAKAQAEVSNQNPITYPCWVQSDGIWYYRLSECTNAHGWRVVNHHKYWFDESGKMVKGWKEINGLWYYFQPSGGLEGALYRSDSNGVQSVWYID